MCHILWLRSDRPSPLTSPNLFLLPLPLSLPPPSHESLFDSNSSEYASRNAAKLTTPVLTHAASTPSPAHHRSPFLSPLAPYFPKRHQSDEGEQHAAGHSSLTPEKESLVSDRRLRGLPNIEFEAFHWKSGNQRRFQLVDGSGLHFGSALWIGLLSIFL